MLLPLKARRPGPLRVLFLRPDRIGDMIVSTGVLRAIGGAPGVVLDVLASPANAPVLAHEPHVHDVIVLDRSQWRRVWRSIRSMRAKDYDVVVDCMPTAPSVTTLMLMLCSGARRRVGTSGRGIDEIFSPATPSLPLHAHIVDHLTLLVAPFRADAAFLDSRPVIVLTDDEIAQAESVWNAARDTSGAAAPRLRLLVNISAGKTSRRWPLASYAAVVAAAREVVPDVQLCIMSAPHDKALGESLAATTKGRYVNTRSLRDAFALVSRADVLFTPDTSVAHAAAAFGVPTVDMLLTGKASQWGLYRAPGVNLESPDDSLLSLTAATAGAALQQLLTEVMLRQRRPDATSHPSAA
jgi:ADP-heptose:LPS heptosyltransferase